MPHSIATREERTVGTRYEIVNGPPELDMVFSVFREEPVEFGYPYGGRVDPLPVVITGVLVEPNGIYRISGWLLGHRIRYGLVDFITPFEGLYSPKVRRGALITKRVKDKPFTFVDLGVADTDL